MATSDDITKDTILQGPFWPEKVRVLTAEAFGNGELKIEAVGIETHKFYPVILQMNDLDSLEAVKKSNFSFNADGEDMFLYIESHRIRNAYQFDPLYGVNVSQIDPLPHQIDAVYHHILQNPRIRFMLADDPGAGKTIMAGLLLKELKYRGLVERTLIAVPGHLKNQWLREMKEKFHEKFIIVDRNLITSSWGQNTFNENNQIVVSIDFAKQDDVKYRLKDTHWDLIIVDEAHKMSAYKYGEKTDKTARYRVGELFSSISNYMIFMTATPHRGDSENFRLLLDLLEPGFFATTDMLAESIRNKENPLLLRRLKEDLRDINNKPLFPPRNVETIKYPLSEEEKMLYNAVTDYVKNHFNKAIQKEKRNVAFALTILQRRLASSTRAIRKSLERRAEKLKKLLHTSEHYKESGFDEDYLEDMEGSEREEIEEDILAKLTSAESKEELKEEISIVENLASLAKDVEKKDVETKINQLKEIMNEQGIKEHKIKLLVFTESRDTLEFIAERLRKWGYSVVVIHGGMDLDTRIRAESEFKHNDNVQIMVSTEAGGEGINLQFCWLMINYDIPWNPNRLEQRMGRIHRYGQTHEVTIFNLVSIDTVEGRILRGLFDKLRRIKDHLGSDRVFDVIGSVLSNRNLKDLIMDALRNPVTMEEILEEFESDINEETIHRIKKAADEGLATRHIDFTSVLGDQRKARENKLVPEYTEKFFLKACDFLDIKVDEQAEGIFRAKNVPADIRNRSHEFRIKYGDVNKEYSKISFDKSIVRSKQSEFIAMGHPLFESVIDHIFQRTDTISSRGATFIDPDGKLNGIIWFLECELKDGTGQSAGRRLFAVYQQQNGEMKFINAGILWDLEPCKSVSQQDSAMPVDSDMVMSYVVRNGLDEYKREILERRMKDARIKEKYGIRSFDEMILQSEEKLARYEERITNGEDIPEVVLQNEKRKKEELDIKKKQLLTNIRASTSLTSSIPKLIAAVRVKPAGLTQEMKNDREVEQVGMDVALRYERDNGRNPEDVSSQKPGYDIKSEGKEEIRYIEVKARSRTGAISLSENEWIMASRLREEFWLYVVENASTNPQLHTIQDPFSRFRPDKEVVKYIIKNWKER